MPLVFVTTQAKGCQIHPCEGKTRPFPSKSRGRPAGSRAPFHALGIGAVCYIPRLHAQRDNVTNDAKALPGAPAAVHPRRCKRVPTVALR